MIKKVNVIAYLIAIIIDLICACVFYTLKLNNYLLVFLLVGVVLIITFVNYLVSNRNSNTSYKTQLGRIMKTYEAVLAKIESLPSLNNKNIILVDNLDDFLDAQQELRRPIFYYKEEENCTFIIKDNEDLILYLLKQNPNKKCEIENEILELKIQGSDEKVSNETLMNLENTTIFLLKDKKLKVSPVRDKKENEVIIEIDNETDEEEKEPVIEEVVKEEKEEKAREIKEEEDFIPPVANKKKKKTSTKKEEVKEIKDYDLKEDIDFTMNIDLSNILNRSKEIEEELEEKQKQEKTEEPKSKKKSKKDDEVLEVTFANDKNIKQSKFLMTDGEADQVEEYLTATSQVKIIREEFENGKIIIDIGNGNLITFSNEDIETIGETSVFEQEIKKKKRKKKRKKKKTEEII